MPCARPLRGNIAGERAGLAPVPLPSPSPNLKLAFEQSQSQCTQGMAHGYRYPCFLWIKEANFSNIHSEVTCPN